MNHRFIYALKKAIAYRKELKIVNQKNHHIKKVTDITADFLSNNSIKYLALDFDGVLNSHGKVEPEKSVLIWLENISQLIGEKNIFILSNLPKKSRVHFFKNNFPQINFIYGGRKKPFPDGLVTIKNILQCNPEEICLVDDRLLTGVLSCLLAKSYPILVTKPFMDKKHSIKEYFFRSLRYIEKKIFL